MKYNIKSVHYDDYTETFVDSIEFNSHTKLNDYTAKLYIGHGFGYYVTKSGESYVQDSGLNYTGHLSIPVIGCDDYGNWSTPHKLHVGDLVVVKGNAGRYKFIIHGKSDEGDTSTSFSMGGSNNIIGFLAMHFDRDESDSDNIRAEQNAIVVYIYDSKTVSNITLFYVYPFASGWRH